jgi:Zn-dependent peptidase ImmA (M78 family)
VLKWARESSLLKVDEAARIAHVSQERLEAAESGGGMITFRQVQRLAHACNIPLRTLFLDAPPAEEATPLDFRSAEDQETPATFHFVRVLRTARERRDVATMLYASSTRVVPTFPSFNSDSELAEILSRVACVDYWPALLRDAKYQRSSARPLSITKEFVERSFPVLVFESPKKLGTVRGCSLFGEPLSVVILTTKESPNTRRFTLIHELAHLFMRQSGICAPLSTSKTNQTERRCNRIAGEALIPRKLLTEVVRKLPRDMSNDKRVDSLANRFQVSKSAVVVALHEVSLLTSHDAHMLLQTYNRFWAEQQERGSSGGPHPYLSVVQHRGPTFTSLVLQAVDRNTMSVTRASELLGVAPSYSNIESLRDKMFEAYGS